MSAEHRQFRNLTNDELRATLIAAADGTTEDADRFFGGFKYVYDLFHGNPSTALNQGMSLLANCLAIDADAYSSIHKGTIYYWLGTAAFLINEHELAAFFFDAAVSEDLRAGAHPVDNPTPALRFIQVDGEPPEQAARQLVQGAQRRIEELIDNYNARFGRPVGVSDLTLPQLRESFLRPAVSPGCEGWRSLATAFISFGLEWDFRNMLLDIRPGQGTAEPFYLHLFKGCVLFESLLKGNPTMPLPARVSTLGTALQHLRSQLCLPNNIRIGSMDLPTILVDLQLADESIQSAVQFTGRIRNTVGHNLGWAVTLDKIQYHRLFRMVASSCLHAIACLYR